MNLRKLSPGLALGTWLMFLSVQAQQKQEKMTLYYVYDALCGWCYGFSPVIQSFASSHPELEIRVVAGGMVRGERIGPIGEVAPYISWAYKEVERASGHRFGNAFLEGILKPGTAVFSSVPSAQALVLFRRLMPEKQLAYAADLQRMVYFDGVPPMHWEAYASRAEAYGLDSTEFLKQLQSSDKEALAEADFALATDLGVSGFPTLILEKGSGQRQVLARGFMPLVELERVYGKLR